MNEAVVGALVGGAFALIGGFAGGVGLDALRTRRAGTTAARLLFLEMLGNVAEYQRWQRRVIDRFDPLLAEPQSAAHVAAELAIVNALREPEVSFPPDGFFPAASRAVERATGQAVDPPDFGVRAWELYGAAFTAAAPLRMVGPVHGAYVAVSHGEPTYERLRAGADAVGEMGYPATPTDAIALIREQA